MIKIENTETFGWEAAVRGMRNPMNSWDKSDSAFWSCPEDKVAHTSTGVTDPFYTTTSRQYSSKSLSLKIGTNDFDLMKRLRNAGTDHRKYMRMITVYCDITAPLYWWKEFDTYKVGTVANSCSTMHKIQAKKFDLDDFSHEHLIPSKDDIDAMLKNGLTPDTDEYITFHNIDDKPCFVTPEGLLKMTCDVLNHYRDVYLKTKDKKYWWQMIQLLPSSYNQKRTVMMNYEVLANIYPSRKNHKLDEWHDFCDWIKTLPYSELISGEDE